VNGPATAAGRRTGPVRLRIRRFWAGVSAVGTKELRGRMRGRRAFVILTIYLLLLSLFAFAIYHYLKQQAALGTSGFGPMPGMPDMDWGWYPGMSGTATALSANIGHGIFGGLLLVETLLIVVLAPALTSGAISLEREKQTIDMLVTTPLSTLGMVIGKLLSALTYVFLLILASVPLASLVFVFGGVGPEDLVRGYALLFAVAFGMGAIGLFISALVRRTQTAIVATFVTVLVLAIGTIGVHEFWKVASRPAPTGRIVVAQKPHQAPEAALWLNPFVADLDLVCTTAPGAYHPACTYMSSVTGKPYFGSADVPVFGWGEEPAVLPGPFGRDAMPAPIPNTESLTAGFPRDTFWPKSAAAFLGLGLVLTLLSAQLVAPTRRLRLPRLPARRRPPAPEATDTVDAAETTA
jgi:ABC-type transport system involved in multi-copper enzyme maturation permease subunit